MENLIACFIAGCSIAAFHTLWFVVSYRELSSTRQSILNAREQRNLHDCMSMEEVGEANQSLWKNTKATIR